MSPDVLDPAFTALDAADAAVEELHEGCCQPLRSPRMEALANTLTRARVALDGVNGDGERAIGVIGLLEDAGAQLGHLQVACCTPARMKLYAETLASLSRVQRAVTREFGLEH
ncbi:MAG TPA: hypothetical protein VMM81_02990 [Acidimicrobiia bacterium]|nr:hypothetical protein [Acidimicrobiia bacterium]